jgi:FAD/FMN-containing dehydrogenase
VAHGAAAIEIRGVIIHDDGPAGRNGQLLDLLVAQVGRGCRRDLRRMMTYTEAKRELAEPAQSAGTRPTLEFSKSEFFRRQLPEHGIADLLANLTRGCLPGQIRSLSFTPWGGAYNRVPAGATAFAHRGELFLLEYLVRVDNEASAADQAAARAWVDRSWTLTHPFGAGRVYPNFPDTALTGWARAYHAINLERLLEVKRRYDPGGWFRFPQSLAGITHLSHSNRYSQGPGAHAAIDR